MASSTSPAHAPHGSAGIAKYIGIWVALLFLTFGTFGVSKLPMPAAGHFAAALAIACVKVSLVVLFFMHLKDAEGSNKLVFVTSLSFVAVLLFFVLADVKTRFPLANSRVRGLPQVDQRLLQSGTRSGGEQGPRRGEQGVRK